MQVFFLSFFFCDQLYNLQTHKLFHLEDLIEFFNLKKNLIVIEYNGKVTNPQNWLSIEIKNHDKIEIISIVGGG